MSTGLVITEILLQITKAAEVKVSTNPEIESHKSERKEMEGDSQSPLMTWSTEQINDDGILLDKD